MAETKKLGPVGGLFFGLLFTVIGYVIAFYVGKPILDNANASNDWPSVHGEIIRSEVATRRSDGKTMYSFDIVYQYKVEGRELKCSNVYFGGEGSSSNSSSAYSVTDRYPKGTQVDVYYEPDHPANAVLEPGAHWQSYLLFGAGLVFLGVGLLIVGSSVFYILAAGAILGTAVAAWMGSSSRSSPAAQGSFTSSDNMSPTTSRPADLASDDGDDGFDMT
ncbi:DUF3592 domain-containing protein [bacterium]|nr:DUF3592 domain-containing protein [bacterium]